MLTAEEQRLIDEEEARAELFAEYETVRTLGWRNLYTPAGMAQFTKRVNAARAAAPQLFYHLIPNKAFVAAHIAARQRGRAAGRAKGNEAVRAANKARRDARASRVASIGR